MHQHTLRELGWKPFFDRQVNSEHSDWMPARVAAHFGSQVLIHSEVGEATVPTKLTTKCGNIAVGDWVLVDPDTHRFMDRLERETEVGRKSAGTAIDHQLIAANIDTIFIVSSCNQDHNLSRIERYLALTLESGATPVVVLTKADLDNDANAKRREVEKLHAGLVVETVDARVAEDVAVLLDWCNVGKTVGLLGSSGVGKSTLANTMGVGNLPTSGIREADGKGRHTTTARSLHRIGNGGWLLDTPGMRELQLAGCEDGVQELFREVAELATLCQFGDCNHQGDFGCALAAAVQDGQLDQRRLTNYLKLLAEQARNGQSLRERRHQDKKFGKMCKSIMTGKRKSRDFM